MPFDFKAFRVLLVEDNDFVRFMVRKYLTEFGFTMIDEGINGVEGIAQLEKKPHIVICDIAMDELDGLAVLKYLRAQEEPLNHTPFIFLTSNADSATVQQAIELEVDAYLLKPVMPEALKKKIITLMSCRLAI